MVRGISCDGGQTCVRIQVSFLKYYLILFTGAKYEEAC